MLKVFPELKESEDERIRKELIAFIKSEGQHIDKYKWHKWIAWLEKQWKPTKEQMKALHDLNLTGNISYVGQGQCLLELYNKLKEL